MIDGQKSVGVPLGNQKRERGPKRVSPKSFPRLGIRQTPEALTSGVLCRPNRGQIPRLSLKLPELESNISHSVCTDLRFAPSLKVETWSMRAITMINLRFVSCSGEPDRCGFRILLRRRGCIDFGKLRSIPTRVGEIDRRTETSIRTKSENVGTMGRSRNPTSTAFRHG